MGRVNRERLPETLGWDFWFLLSVLPSCVAGDWWAYVRNGGAQIFIVVTVGAAILQQLATRIGKVRLARMLRDNPDIARSYYSPEP